MINKIHQKFWPQTYLTRITLSASFRHRKVMGSMLGCGKPSTWCSMLSLDIRCTDSASMLTQYQVIAKYVKSCTYCCYVRCATLIVQVCGNVLAPNRSNSVRTSIQWSCNQMDVWLLFSKAIPMWWVCVPAWSALVWSGRDQVPQHPIDTYRYISHIHISLDIIKLYIIIFLLIFSCKILKK